MNRHFIVLAVTFSLWLSGCGSDRISDTIIEKKASSKNVNSSTTKAFFGDKENNKIIIVDVKNMKLIKESENYTNHKITYAICDLRVLPKLYVSNRGSNAIDVINTETLSITNTIKLQHFPRSADAINEELGLIAVSGMDKPMISIIDIYTDTVVAVVGDNITTGPVDSKHGSHACGHPYWLNKNHFVLIDRARKRLTTYKIYKDDNNNWVTKELNTRYPSTSSHQLVPRDNYMGDKNKYYLINEGSATTYPSVTELKFEEGYGLKFKRKVKLINKDVPKEEMGAHHGDFVPNKTLLYVGSKEGMMYIINYDTMKVQTKLLAGLGAGHTKMISEKDMAVIINHKDKFITIFDTKNSEIIKDLVVSNLPDSDIDEKTIQAHPNYFVSNDTKYFYMFLTEEARFIKIDLDSLKLVDSLYVGGKPAMGTFR